MEGACPVSGGSHVLGPVLLAFLNFFSQEDPEIGRFR